jgi:hypothetical protein
MSRPFDKTTIELSGDDFYTLVGALAFWENHISKQVGDDDPSLPTLRESIRRFEAHGIAGAVFEEAAR